MCTVHGKISCSNLNTTGLSLFAGANHAAGFGLYQLEVGSRCDLDLQIEFVSNGVNMKHSVHLRES